MAKESYASVLGKKLIGTVKRYDREKDFGFMSLSELNFEVYFKLAKLEKNELDTIHDGDVVFCSLAEGEKGVQISTLDGFVEGRNEMTIGECSVKFYNSDRGFGFATIGKTSNEAFFHKTAFPPNFYEHLIKGLEFKAEIKLKEDKKYEIRRCLELI